MRRRLVAFTRWARVVVEAVTVAAIAAYTAIVLLQVIFRYVLNESLFWSEELVRYGLVWSVLLGSAVVAHDRAHVKIDLVGPMLGPRGMAATNLVARAATVAFCMILAVTGWQFVDRTIFQSSASLGVPMWLFYGAVPVGAALETWFTLFAPPAAERDDGEPLI
jgi:C4-dicarboxylate transporter DctQ subunit